MSYNLMAEGDLDLFELSEAAHSYEPLELFPIPAIPAHAPDAVGIAVPSSRSGAEATAALRALIEFFWAKGAAVYDLYTGDRISSEDDLAELESRIAA